MSDIKQIVHDIENILNELSGHMDSEEYKQVLQVLIPNLEGRLRDIELEENDDKSNDII